MATKSDSVVVSKERLRSFQKAIDAWRNTKTNDAELKAVYKADADALQAVYDVVAEGKYKQAFRLAWKLDTIVRDQIPDTVYNLLAKAAKMS